MIFETHAHYEDARFDEDRESLLNLLPQKGIAAVVNVASGVETTKQTLALAERYPFLYGSVGIHPDNAKEADDPAVIDWLRAQAVHEKVVAIGEIGLDYYYEEPERGIQKECFRKQLRLSNELHLPIIVHSRDAAEDTYQLLQAEHNGKQEGGVIHCFSYGCEMADRFLELGYYIGIGGVVTFKNAKKCKEVVEHIPLNYLVLETDCPYMAPEPYRGKRNSSLFLELIAEKIAEIKGVDAEKVMRITEENGKRLYRLGKSLQ